MKQIKDLLLPYAIVLSTGAVFAFLLSPMPLDETRYLSVAWEMTRGGSYLVPHLNGLPYAHKPPLLFWLINLDWLLVGVNEKSLRLIPALFSLCTLTLVHRIALMLWDDRTVARHAALVLSSLLIYLAWSVVIMFDMLLAFWVLVGMVGLLTASRQQHARGWLLTGIAMGCGMLTKGPVILVHLLPTALLGFAWLPDGASVSRWYRGLLFSVFLGLAIMLLWVIPAVTAGGASYRDAILWGQTAHRVVASFAHRQPMWWYVPVLPLMLFPWVLVKPAWGGWAGMKEDKGLRFVWIWIVSTFILFSCISGKQPQYLLPVLPAFSLLMARGIAGAAGKGEAARWRYPVALFYAGLGGLVMAVPWFDAARQVVSVSDGLRVGGGLIAVGALLALVRPRSFAGGMSGVAVASAVCFMILVAGGRGVFERYDMHGISRVLREKQEAGYEIIHYGKYHGQYQFMGRLNRPLIVLNDAEAVHAYARAHEKVLLLTYVKLDTQVDERDVVFQQMYRSGRVVLWNNRGLVQLVSR